MRLATFGGRAAWHVGIVDGEEILDLTAADPSLATMIDLLTRGPAAAVSAYSAAALRLPLASVKLGPPVPRPPKFLAIGYNYAAHLEETHMQRPTRQTSFNKQQTSIVGPGDPVWIPRIAPDEIDFEGELGVVIGRRWNGDLRQDGHTKDMLFNIYEQVSYLSSAFTLEVGDVLSTGRPSGIAWHRPGMYLKAGDTVRVEIDKIGTLENPVIAEPA
jgi:2-keto-4-pentenoate hydratase/2-oxohepta-3-ene-1,7-dioic acid hydratase in catechol pathway